MIVGELGAYLNCCNRVFMVIEAIEMWERNMGIGESSAGEFGGLY